MKSDKSLIFANKIWQAWKYGTLIKVSEIEASISPRTRLRAYEVQKNYISLSSQGVFGWKIAASNKFYLQDYII